MTEPWIEIRKVGQQAGGDWYDWHALFALRVNVPSSYEMIKLKWGFNASAYLEENLYRQKVFLQSQHGMGINSHESPEKRTLAIRCINKPGAGLLLSVIGKAVGTSEEDSRVKALAYCREIESTFTYDYFLSPARSQEEFNDLTGVEIFETANTQGILQIKRFENSIPAFPREENILGRWQAGRFANEQIWRGMSGLPYEALLNITLRPTILWEKEKQLILDLRQRALRMISEQSNSAQSLIYRTWIDPLVNRRLSPWSRYFYLQVHLLARQEVGEGFIRSVGNTITESIDQEPVPEYDVRRPAGIEEAMDWRKKLYLLDFPFAVTTSPIPRLVDMADMEEVTAVCRFPVPPPEQGLPGVVFLNDQDYSKEHSSG